MDSIIDMYATMITRGKWDEEKVPPQLIDQVNEKLEELKQLKGGETEWQE